MGDLDRALGAVADNRRQYEAAVATIQRNTTLTPQERARRLRDAWATAMRRHYRLVERCLDMRRKMRGAAGDVDPWLLRAPERPAGLPRSRRLRLGGR